jgi:protein-S-isoprenylcysteine O-methyltransferase Ste14
MQLSTTFDSPAPQISRPNASTWTSIAAWLVRRRVRLTVLIFVALMAEDVLIGVKPHDLLNVRDPETAFGLALVGIGLAIRSWAAGVLHKTWELTTTGPYAVIRNPLYLGSFLIMCGFATLVDDYENIFVILGPLAFLYYLQIRVEERRLEQMYGARWTAYASDVPRMFPRRLPKWDALFTTWSQRDWVGSREYRAMGATLLGLAAVQLWRIW